MMCTQFILSQSIDHSIKQTISPIFNVG